MRRFLIVLCGLGIAIFMVGQSVRAQGVVEAETMQIDIWPEYDRRDALVIYRIVLSAQTSLPAQIMLRIPREAVAPFNVAYKDVDNKLYNMQYNSTVEGDWLRITATSPAQEIQFEYYDPRLARTSAKRLYEYRWSGDMKVRNMVFRVQQPLNATDMQISPQKGTQSVEGSLTYYSIPVGAVEAGTAFAFQISYNKPDESLSAVSLPVKSSEPITPNQTGDSNLGAEANTIILGFAMGVGLIAIGLFWYFRTQRKETIPVGKRRHSADSDRRARQADSGKSTYCHQCGKRSNPGDTFCRACGTKFRLE